MPTHNTGGKSYTGLKNTQAPPINNPDSKRLGMENGQVGKFETQNNSARDRALDRRKNR